MDQLQQSKRGSEVMGQAGGNGSKDCVNAAMLQWEEEGAQLTDVVDNNGPGSLLTCSTSWDTVAAY
eukprot:6763225-Ditylum_brightwellii.AAC.1